MYVVTSWCLLPSAEEFPLSNLLLQPLLMASALFLCTSTAFCCMSVQQRACNVRD